MPLDLASTFHPTGDQPRAIDELTEWVRDGYPHATLLGVTGSGKTFTMAGVIAETRRPTLVISPNKTLAAQLYGEFKEFFPSAAVHYFVSYYDYYQPEAYVPSTDTYIEKEADINEEIDRLRHAATQSILTRDDVIIVASVSCIYGLGSPEEYGRVRIPIRVGSTLERKQLLGNLVDLQFQRNDIDLHRGTFRVKGDTIEIFPSASDKDWVRIEYSGKHVERITARDIGGTIRSLEEVTIFPATHYVAPQKRFHHAVDGIREELTVQLRALRKDDKLLEAQRLEQRTRYDLEMLEETGYVHGIENYSRYFDGREPGQPPCTLIDFYNYAYGSSEIHGPASSARRDEMRSRAARSEASVDALRERAPQRTTSPKGRQHERRRSLPRSDAERLLPGPDRNAADSSPVSRGWLTFVDESHITIPQLRGMHAGDRSRKQTLVSFGFRLPSCLDNRPLMFEEFRQRVPQTIYVSATPEEYELTMSVAGQRTSLVAEQLIRPTGLLDPEVEVRPTTGQVDDLIREIQSRVVRGQRTLVTVLTKRMAEDLADYLNGQEIDVTTVPQRDEMRSAGTSSERGVVGTTSSEQRSEARAEGRLAREASSARSQGEATDRALRKRQVKAFYIHADVETFERIEILDDLRRGTYDVIVGINLLREGLDLPEVSLVAILDADKEGYLRSATALIQTMGRAARHIEGTVILYADRTTESMRIAISETQRRRARQDTYNREHGITPRSITKEIRGPMVAPSSRETGKTAARSKKKRRTPGR